ncbi:MAG: hypothetical protein KAI35_04065 [Desulfobulbaceae bacterium]|nr:hypothetical protein [Desulfobulbaceae bacterium]
MDIKVKIKNRVYPVQYNRENGKIRVTVQDRSYLVDAAWAAPGRLSLLIDKSSCDAVIEGNRNNYNVLIQGNSFAVDFYDPRERRPQKDLKRSLVEGRQSIHAPMAGQIIRILVDVGDLVDNGQGIVLLEAMKMENELKSQGLGHVKEILVAAGDIVEPGQELLVIE